MGRSTHCRILFGLLALVAAGSCGGDKAPAATGATVRKAAPTTVPADPYAVPATIDKAYLDRVFAALERVDGDATRIIVAKGTMVPDASARLRAIYAEDEFQAQVNLWLDIVIQKQLDRFKNPPGDRLSRVDRVLTGRRDCVFVGVLRDYSAITSTTSPPAVEYVTLRPADAARDQANLNPTPWMISSEGYKSDGSVPRDPCVA